MRPSLHLSVEDLSPSSNPTEEHQFVILRSYFDGANQADSTQYDVLTLAILSGTKEQWQPLESAWMAVLKQYEAEWLHTTDAAALSAPYSQSRGWDKVRRDSFLNDCVSAIEPFLVRKLKDSKGRVRPTPPRLGVYPCTVSVVLKEHVAIRATRDDIPRVATEICAMQALHRCLEWGRDIMRAHFYNFVFDRGEPFRGHIEDRRKSRKATKAFPVLKRLSSVTDADMRRVPALQVADFFAWCVSHRRSHPYHTWQRRLLKLDRVDDWIDAKYLSNPNRENVDLAKQWGLPVRKPNR